MTNIELLNLAKDKLFTTLDKNVVLPLGFDEFSEWVDTLDNDEARCALLEIYKFNDMGMYITIINHSIKKRLRDGYVMKLFARYEVHGVNPEYIDKFEVFHKYMI